MFNKLVSCILLLLIIISNSAAQESNSSIVDEAFANFLFSSKLYDLAAEEYERILFYEPNDMDVLSKLIKCYTFTGNEQLVDRRFDLVNTEDKQVALSYYDLLLQLGNADKLEDLHKRQQDLFSPQEQKDIAFEIAVAKYDWPVVQQYDLRQDQLAYRSIVSKVEETNFKKPGVAAALSALIPGAGRVYAKDAKDGIISFIFVGSFAFQSYRRFSQQGIDATGGWVFGGLALGFYVSNIYGSYQSAKFYNKKQNEKIYSFSLPKLLADSP